MKYVNIIYDLDLDEYDLEKDHIDYDLMLVPDIVADNIGNVLSIFDDWVSDKRNVHNYWTICDGVKTIAVTSTEFADWLTNVYLKDCTSKIEITINPDKKFDPELPLGEF